MHSPSLSQFSDSVQVLAAAAAQHVVAVNSPKSRSSGFLWKDGLVITAEEALGSDDGITVALPDGTTVPAILHGRDPSTDIALLRVEGAKAPQWPDAASADFGSLALAVGRDSDGPLVAMGLVTKAGAQWHSMRGGVIDQRLELDLRLRRAMEGGVVMSADGKFLGMAVFGPRRRTLVIPAATLLRVAAKLETDGRIARGYLGLGLQPVAVGEGHGAMVMSVDPQGPAQAAGVLQGDIIVTWDDAAVTAVRPLVRSLGPDSVGRAVKLGLSRAGAPHHVTLTVSARPAA